MVLRFIVTQRDGPKIRFRSVVIAHDVPQIQMRSVELTHVRTANENTERRATTRRPENQKNHLKSSI